MTRTVTYPCSRPDVSIDDPPSSHGDGGTFGGEAGHYEFGPPGTCCLGTVEWRRADQEVEGTVGTGAYKAQATAVAKSLRFEANGNRNSPPSVIADAIGKAVTASRPKTRYAVGFGAKPLITARGLLSDRQFDALISRAVGLTSK